MTNDGVATPISEAARAGSREAFESLIHPLIEPACQFAHGILHDWQEAEDAVQEAAYKTWKNMHKLRPDTISLRPWFFTIVRNQCLSVRRGRWFSVVRSAEIRPASSGSAEDRTAGRLDLERALAGLKEKQRLVLLLHCYLDMPLEEVGAVLGISAGGAKSMLYRALAKLRPSLEAPGTIY